MSGVESTATGTARLVEVTERAQREIREIFEREHPGPGTALRLGVMGGGCSGLSYQMEFDRQQPHDNVVEFDGFLLLLDPKSSIYMKGVTLDYQDGLKGKGFVFQNPNATNTCGCGDSFSI
jgi:iron-sulfur cluster assembly protein